MRTSLRLQRLLGHVCLPGRSASFARLCSSSSQPGHVLCSAATAPLHRLTLNREKKLNSLNLEMIHDIDKYYKSTIPPKSIVWLEGAGAKAFCAGGDVAALAQALGETPRNPKLGYEFFWHEYRVDYMLATAHERGVVNVAVWDKIVLGGGVGLGYHAPIRIVTETTAFAMPETNIGLFPDVGMTWALSRLGGRSSTAAGRWLGLTGTRLVGGVDCLKFGIGTHFVAQKDLEQVFEHLAGFQGEVSIDAVRSHLGKSPLVTTDPDQIQAETAKATSWHTSLGAIEKSFGKDSLTDCMEALKQSDDKQLAESSLKALSQMSPISLRVTWEAIERHKGAEVTFRDALRMEYHMACHCMGAEADFQEGVTGLLIEKRERKWRIAQPEDVPDSLVKSFFGPLPAGQDLGELPI